MSACAALDPWGLARKMATRRKAALRLDRLALFLGLPEDEAAEAAAELVNGGLATVWERGPGGHPALVLSSLAVEKLNLELVNGRHGGNELWWQRKDKGPTDHGPRPNPHFISATDVMAAGDGADPVETAADPNALSPGYGLELEDARKSPRERREAARGGSYEVVNAVPYPHLLIGLMPPWPVGPLRDGRCGGCGGKKIPLRGVCLVCHASGVDAILEPVERPRVRKPRPKAAPVLDDQAEGKPTELAGGTGKARPGKVREPAKPKRKHYKRRLKQPGGFSGAPNSFKIR